jgi:hypothetical protein
MENETEETQETQNTQGTPETLEAIKAQLEEEKRAKAADEAALAEKDQRIAELQVEGEALRAERSNLQASLSEVSQASEAAAAELAQVKEVNAQAVVKYLDVVRLANPTIPQDIIAGDTIEAIDASVEKALYIANAVKASLEAQAREARVPAGAPARGEISLEGLTPREKIAAGIQQKGGTS